MSSESIQIDDVPAQDIALLRELAAARKMTLSAYLREVILEESSGQLTMSDFLAKLAEREPVYADTEDIRAFIEDGRG